MFTKVSRNETRVRRHKRVRTKISGTPECPRLCVFRSNAHIHVQIIDDVNQNTLVSASSVDMKLENGGNVEAARLVGTEIAKRVSVTRCMMAMRNNLANACATTSSVPLIIAR